jgi:hypothetical protein
VVSVDGADADLGVVLLVVAVEVGGVVGFGDVAGVVRCCCPWTPICNVGTRDMPVINITDNKITPNFDVNFLSSIYFNTLKGI